MNEYVNRLKELEPGYRPSPETITAIKDKSLLAFIGGFAVGKTTLMREIARVDERFSEVISFTTRPSRGHSDIYRFIDNSPGNVKLITAKAQQGDLVNFAVHPTTEYVYGTESDDYRTEFCMLATTANNFQLSTSGLPFRSVDPVTIVSDSSVWAHRMSQRSMSLAEYKARIDEAKQSLEWSLDCDDMFFIDNTDTDINSTARQFTTSLELDDAKRAYRSRRIAEKMLSYVNTQTSE